MKTCLSWLWLPLTLALAACGGGDEDPGTAGGSSAGGTAGRGGAGTAGATGGVSGASGQAGATAGVGGAGTAGASSGAAGATAGSAGATAGAAGTAGSSAGAGTGGADAGMSGASGGGGDSGAAGESGSAGTAGTAGMSAGGSGGASAGTAGAGGGVVGCGTGGACQTGFVCKYETCVPDLGACTTNDDCPGDSYCDADKTCVPYGVPPTVTNDPSCQKPTVPVAVAPTVQCEWKATAAGDKTAGFTNIYSTPVVAELNLDGDPKKIQPSIVVTTFGSVDGTRTGMLRVFDGRTCQEQMRIGGPDDADVANNRPTYSSHWAIGDLDNDVAKGGHPEIVGTHRTGATTDDDKAQVIAFKIDTKTDPKKPRLVRSWLGRDCANKDAPVLLSSNESAAALGVSLHDLDDDGIPEVLADTLVFDSKGCVLNAKPTVAVGNRFSTIADVDLDGKPDLVAYNGIYGWDTTTKNWVKKSWSNVPMDTTANPAVAFAMNYVAVVDVGAYSVIPGKKATDPLPEIVAVTPNKIAVFSLTGALVYGPVAIYDDTGIAAGSNKGGTPTAADFDGDGQVEFATAGATYYTVYDPDCVKGADTKLRPGGKCVKPNKALPDGILWARPSQDKSSNVTGSSVFDFNGDGQAEVVYRDECFVRVYAGATGDVLFSAPASSGTGWEYPTIMDVDGDFATEIVVPRTSTGATSCKDSTNADGSDKLFPKSGAFQSSTGFVVYRDPQDRWVSSRPIWNQHAYSITNVNDDATIPKSSAVLRNWEQPGLNNFRQNTQGSLKATAIADLTVELQDADKLCAGDAGEFTVSAQVCNRGTNPVQDGASVVFTQQVKGQAATALCETVTDTLLAPSDCTVVSCKGTLGADSDVLVSVDPKASIADCHPGNNKGASARVLCGKP